MYEIRKPVCALVHGPALGRGCGLAAVCDFVLASRDRAKFATADVQSGIVPALIAPYLVKRIGEGRAREMILRGNQLTATEAQAMGLITSAVPDDQLEKTRDRTRAGTDREQQQCVRWAWRRNCSANSTA